VVPKAAILAKDKGFINFLSRRGTGLHRRAKRFELNFFIRKTFLWMVKLGWQSHPHSWSISAVPGP